MQAYPFCICYGRPLVNAISLPDRSGESNIYPLCAAYLSIMCCPNGRRTCDSHYR
jgi:hypothetical protein